MIASKRSTSPSDWESFFDLICYHAEAYCQTNWDLLNLTVPVIVMVVVDDERQLRSKSEFAKVLALKVVNLNSVVAGSAVSNVAAVAAAVGVVVAAAAVAAVLSPG